MSYEDYLESEDWKKKRRKKFARKRRCGICGSTENLNVHHINYGNLYDVEMSDLRVLCERCHKLAHELIKAGKINFKNTNHHSRFGITKGAVKKYLGLKNRNMFRKRKVEPGVQTTLDDIPKKIKRLQQ